MNAKSLKYYVTGEGGQSAQCEGVQGWVDVTMTVTMDRSDDKCSMNDE